MLKLMRTSMRNLKMAPHRMQGIGLASNALIVLLVLMHCSVAADAFSPARTLAIKHFGPQPSTQHQREFDVMSEGGSSPFDARHVHPIIGRSTAAASTSTQLHGIPKMFRWLTDQYPNIINGRLTEGLTPDTDVDSFYLDMNGIIHPCTHGNADGEIVLLDETAMFKKIFMYVDRLYKLVQPSKVLYLAVDGVAPRAKMNQQRSRRFRSAKEAEQAAAEILAREQLMETKNGKPAPPKSDKERFDSNCITPGTDFMLKLSLALQKWVEYKMKTDPFWMNGAQVIVSGPDVPGEGEHKVMNFLREYSEKHRSGKKTSLYAPGWTHVLYGLDADLIMLGLVTHEPRFMLLREKMSVVMAGRGRNKYRKKKDMLEYDRNDFELLELSALRQLLSIQFRKFVDRLDNYKLDRVIDDFVFMCMLVGNDFLPHCPHLEIDSGAISLMITNYIELLGGWGGYLTDKEKIHPKRLEEFIYHLAVYEEEHFKRRGYEENEPGWKLSADEEDDDEDFYGEFYSGLPTPACAVAANQKGSQPPPSTVVASSESASASTSEDPGEGEGGDSDDDSDGPKTGNRTFRRRHPGNQSRSYRDFYYNEKLGWPAEDRERTLFQRRAHVRDYLEGLHWNLYYYHRGCSSWDWYFPHLYSPLATDMVNLGEFYQDFVGDTDTDNDADNDANADDDGFRTFPFEMGTPFPSLAQLLSVLPPQSAGLLPEAIGELMLLPTSPLINFYPPDFKQDPNGKRQPWEAVVQVPFIESDILLETVTQVLDEDKKTGGTLLTPAERRRNVRGKDHLFKPPGGGDVPGPVGGAKRAKKGAAKRKTGSAPPSRSGPRGVRKTGGTSNGNARSKSKSKTVPKRKRAQPKGATRKTGALAEPTTTAEGSD